MRYILKIITLSISVNCLTQVQENFTDGEFTSNPIWTGATADFIVNSDLELQLNALNAGSSVLSVLHGMSDLEGMEWRFKARLSFSPSTSNYGRFYLDASTSDPLIQPTGYYIQLGEAGSNDAVKLFEYDGMNTTLICSGQPGDIASSFTIGIQVKKDFSGTWHLFYDASGGENYQYQSSGSGTSLPVGGVVRWQMNYTASNTTKFYLDDIYAGQEILDLSAPKLMAIRTESNQTIRLIFDETLDSIVARNASNYGFSPNHSIIQATWSNTLTEEVLLQLNNPMNSGEGYTVTVLYAKDQAGNDTTNQEIAFEFIEFSPPQTGDVVINEIMADPSPSAGLPEVEYVEIFNRSDRYFDLTNWQLTDGSAIGILPKDTLRPGEYKLLVVSTVEYPTGTPVAVFPSLNNSGDNLVLLDSASLVLDSVSYSDSWYLDADKKNGGFSLERIQPFLLCSPKENWRACNSTSGGTPGFENSVFSAEPDTIAPRLLDVVVSSDSSLLLTWSESPKPLNLNNIALEPNLELLSVDLVEKQLRIKFNQVIPHSFLYTLHLSDIADCEGNVGHSIGTVRKGKNPEKGELIINEILFDPPSGGTDYIELQNQSSSYLELNGVCFQSVQGDSLSAGKCWKENKLLPPNSHAVFAIDSFKVQTYFPHFGEGTFAEMSLPSMPNDSGTVVISVKGEELERLSYDVDWHFALLDSPDGKSLERLSGKGDAQNRNNWHTAAESVSFGTPGLPNSQFQPLRHAGKIELVETVFSPDNDGYQDVLMLSYQLSEPSMVVTLTVFSTQGQMIRRLVENELSGPEGFFVWDGLDENQNKASIGQYILLFEAFTPSGTVLFSAKKACVLAGKI